MRAPIKITGLFPEPQPAYRDLNHYCDCGAIAGLGIGQPLRPAGHELWFCRAHAPADFFPDQRRRA